ncbi:hypothetical protein ACFSCW_01680 [Sphingomonas tabacisoli]|uniref:Uncharacterized protein n=1 Tax=Sphingomonas tabacisoli TaxID=2249466 RepID=A0ABW4HZ70_9SPHN
MKISELWTLPRAVRVGVTSGATALLLWPMHVVFGRPIRPAFAAALVIAAVCGISILLMGVVDLLTVERDRRILPARLFDLALGLALALPTSLALAGLF